MIGWFFMEISRKIIEAEALFLPVQLLSKGDHTNAYSVCGNSITMFNSLSVKKPNFYYLETAYL